MRSVFVKVPYLTAGVKAIHLNLFNRSVQRSLSSD